MTTVSIRRTKRIMKEPFFALPADVIYNMCKNQFIITIDHADNISEHSDTISSIITWCDENFFGFYRFDEPLMYIEHETDAAAFLLKFSELIT